MTAYAKQFPVGTFVAVEDEVDVVHASTVRFAMGVGYYFALRCQYDTGRISFPRARPDNAVNCFNCIRRSP